MVAYIQELRRYAESERVRYEENKRAETQAARERLTPLEERVARLLAKIPETVQREGLVLSSLQRSLRGRWRGNCHPGELGAALRRLNYKRKRNYKGETANRALWYPSP
jgi:hypothetical protein